jgi:hypothetical protein
MIRKFAIVTITLAVIAVSPLCRAQSQEPGADLNQQLGNDQDQQWSMDQMHQPSLDSVIEVARADMRADRAKIISTAMEFSDKDAAAFWPVYRQYERERSALDDRRVAVIKEYSEKYSTLSDADAKTMAERMFDYDLRLAALKKTYFKKFNKVLPAYTVTKFFQLDRRVDLLMDLKVEYSLPPLTQAHYTETGK